MYKHILVAYDGSAGAKLALNKAIAISKELVSSITALWVRDSLPHYPETIDEVDEVEVSSRLFQEKLQNEIDQVARLHHLSINLFSVPGNPAKMILEYAGEHQVQLIIMGQSGHTLWDSLVGHTTHRVTDRAHCDVLIVRK
jgi:nucleotide-binding universal stress UspA family protein